jgi:CspA family cold shock protein
MKGKVKFFNARLRYGFVLGEDGKEYFVPIANLQCSALLCGEEVEFEPQGTANRLRALNVKRINSQDGIVVKGSVRKYDAGLGYGFILNPDGGRDVFVHSSSLIGLEPYLVENDTVEFEIVTTSRGPEAVNVKKV